MLRLLLSCIFFFFNDTATTEIYTLSLHDALPILAGAGTEFAKGFVFVGKKKRSTGRTMPCIAPKMMKVQLAPCQDRKSTRLNSSHGYISYAVFCLKKNNKQISVSALSTYMT